MNRIALLALCLAPSIAQAQTGTVTGASVTATGGTTHTLGDWFQGLGKTGTTFSFGGAITGTAGMVGDQLNLTKNYTTTITGSPHQQVNNANITVPVTTEIWNNFDDVNWNTPGGDASPIGGHVVARYTQIRKSMDSPNVPAMGLIVGVVDFTGHTSNTSGPIVSFELDQEVSGPDNHSGAFGPNGSRVMLSLLAARGRSYAGTDTTINAAMSVFGDTNIINFKRVLNVAAGWTVAAIDLTPGVQIGGAATISMNSGMRIRFNQTGPRDMYWDDTLFGATGGFHLTGQLQVDELGYFPNFLTVGGLASFGNNIKLLNSSSAIVLPAGAKISFTIGFGTDMMWDTTAFSSAGGLTFGGNMQVNGALTAVGDVSLATGTGKKLSFHDAVAIVKPTPTGACAGNTGCQALRDALATVGLINGGSISN